MKQVALQVQNLRKRYGSLKAVDDLSFTVHKGEVYGILGPNGSGKTTTLSILTSVVNPNGGEWRWFGNEKTVNVRKRIGVLLEKPNFFGYLSAVDNLKIVADIRGVSYSEIDDVLRRVNLYQRRNSRFKTYSLGMKQRLAIASVLLGNPEVLILDEPTNGLDAQGIAEMRELIIKLAHEGRTIIIASHYLDEIQKVCTDVMVMKYGSKLYEGKIDALLGNVNKIGVKADDLDRLRTILKADPRVHSIEDEIDGLRLSVDEDFHSSDVNKLAFEKGIILTHLTYQAVSLEDKILTLLNDAEDELIED